MPRDSSFKALILRSRESGESNRLVTLLSEEAGLIDALVYGGPKSKLRSLAVPWHAGRAWVYHDPVKDWYKLSDFDAALTFPGIRSSLDAGLSASLMSELVLKTRSSGGEHGSVLSLILSRLGALDSGFDPLAVSASFIWILCRISGSAPDPLSCGRCGSPLEAGWYALSDGAFICADCIDSDGLPGRGLGEACHKAPAALLSWLHCLSLEAPLPPLPSGTKGAARDILFSLARRLAEGELNSLSVAGQLL